jgi:hypothetical protein
MREELQLAILDMVKGVLNERPVYTQLPYWYREPPWWCTCETEIDTGALTNADTRLVQVGPVGDGSVTVVTDVGYDVYPEAFPTGVETWWMDKNGVELNVEFNRRTEIAGGFEGQSAGLMWPLPFKPAILLWPGETCSLWYNWGANMAGTAQGCLWAYGMSIDKVPKEYWK